VDATNPTTTEAAIPREGVRKFDVSRVGQQLRRHSSVFRDPAVEALAALRAHKLRSALTLLGVTLSVSVLILVVSIITGANLYIQNRVANLGSNVFLVDVGRRWTRRRRLEIRRARCNRAKDYGCDRGCDRKGDAAREGRHVLLTWPLPDGRGDS
jgi:hypothetical protein